jgi:PhnB protein
MDKEAAGSGNTTQMGSLLHGHWLNCSIPSRRANKAKEEIFDEGQVQMPLAKTFFSPLFGMAVDRFGISWMIVVET